MHEQLLSIREVPVETQPVHVKAIFEFADRAFRNLATLRVEILVNVGSMPRQIGDQTGSLLAYRRGDADAAVSYANKSVSLNPGPLPHHALNLAILALAHHQLNHSKEAEKALAEGMLLNQRLKGDPNNRVHHDMLIPELLFREAEALINGKTQTVAGATGNGI